MLNSLKFKILSITLLITLAAVAVATWHTMQTQNLMVRQLVSQNSRILAQTIHNSISSAMQNGRNQEVVNILQKVAEENSISSPRIFDPQGRILLSADPKEIGRQVSAFDLSTYRSTPETFSLSSQDGNLYSSTLPILNSPDCHSCHDPAQKLLGIFNVHFSLNFLDKLQRQGTEANLFSSVAILLIMGISLIGFLLYYVDNPIRKLARAMNQLERGDFLNANTSIKSSAEMALLAEKYNRMVARLRNLLDSTVRIESELAVNREKLLHKDKIERMNLTLEDRLKEIENLNTSLEERIDEVEEANFRIADLASNLEDRNTSLKQVISRLSTLYDTGLVINSTMELKSLFTLLLKKATESLGAEIGYILLYSKETNQLRIGEVIGVPNIDFDSLTEIPLRPGGVSHWVVENRQPLLIKKIAQEPRFERMSLLGFARDSVLCAPLFVGHEIIGTLTIANRPDGSNFYAEDLELLSTIAAQASVAIKNARLYEDQQQIYLNTVQALVSAIEASDNYTRGHSERVTRYSLLIARKLNLSEVASKDLEQAAILHDIGKIGIEDNLLHKPDKLTAEDVKTLQQHPLIGMRILEPIHFMQRVREIIGQHHERYDGCGYPHRIKGEDLLLESRILSVADSYDAMTSDRSYRKALPRKEALREIETHAGSQFDPMVAKALLDLALTGELHAGETATEVTDLLSA